MEMDDEAIINQFADLTLEERKFYLAELKKMDVELSPEEKRERILRMREGTSSRGGRKIIEKMTKGKQVNHLALERAMKARAGKQMGMNRKNHEKINFGPS